MIRRHGLPGVLASLALAVPIHAQDQRVSRVSPDGARSPSEVSVAINPVRPDNVIAVSLQARGPTTNFAYTSFDAGATWTSVAGPNRDGRTQGDDAVVFDGEGNALWSYISFSGLRQDRPENAANGIFVNRSRDGGRTWSEPVRVIDHLNTVAPFEDKPFLTAGGDGRVFIAWTRFSKYGVADPAETSHIFLSRSDDGGRTFSMPFRVSDRPGDAIDSDGTLEGVVPALGVNGEVFLVWAGPEGLVFDRSTDGSWSFGEDRVIAGQPGGWDVEVEGLGRANGMPVTGVDWSDGSFRGTLYVNWVDARHGDLDVFVASSSDAGDSWSAPKRVNDDPIANGAAQFFTWMAIDPLDGSVNVVYYDRAGRTGTTTGVTLARSTDGAESFTTYPVAIDAFETTTDVFFGDYLGIDAHGGRVVCVFTHFIGTARLALSAASFRFD